MAKTIHSRVAINQFSLQWGELLAAFKNVPQPTVSKKDCCNLDMPPTAMMHLLEDNRLEPGSGDLGHYIAHAFYCLNSPAIFRFLLPGLLRHWTDELFSSSDTFSEHLDRVLQEHPEVLTDELCGAVMAFMRDMLLERISQNKDSYVYELFQAIVSYGIVAPEIQSLWLPWWELGNPGSALTALLYASCVICPEQENPFFPPSPPNMVSSAPVLWEDVWYGTKQKGWPQQNLITLRSILTLDNLKSNVGKAGEILWPGQENKHIQLLLDFVTIEGDQVQAKIDQLLEKLAHPE